MVIKKWTKLNGQIKIKWDKLKMNGGSNMDVVNIRNNKIALKSLLMKNVKTDSQGRVLLTKDDEWTYETEWDKLYDEIEKQ